MLTPDMQRVVYEQRLGFAATVCSDGTPNLSPKGTTAVWDDDHLIFADIASPQTVKNLTQNPAIEINVVDPITRQGYRFKGTARILTDGPLFEQIMAFYQAGPEPARHIKSPIRAIVLVRVERAWPLVSPAYDEDVTEAEVAAKWEDYYRWLKERRDARLAGRVEGPAERRSVLTGSAAETLSNH